MTRPFNVALIQPEGYVFSLALMEAAEYLCAMLRQCGFEARLSTNRIRGDAHNVILCAHLLDAGDVPSLPRDSIIFNSEPLGKGDRWHFGSEAYDGILARFHVWDYSERNLAAIAHARKDTIPFWYCRDLVRPRPPSRRARALLFYGAPTPRRRTLLGEIAATGVEVRFMHGMYGSERDAEMFDAWAVLNLHKGDDETVFEPIRCFYPLINRVPVVSEEVRGDAAADAFRDSMHFFGRDVLADRIRALQVDERGFAERAAEQAGNFERKSAVEIVGGAVARYLQAERDR